MNKLYYDYIKREVDDMAIIEQVVKLQRTGMVFKGSCPFHQERTPSFVVYPPGHKNNNDTQEFASFYCFGCGAGGDVIKFYQLYKGFSSYKEAAKDLALKNDLKQPDEPDVQKKYIQELQKEEDNYISMDEINLSCSRRLKNAGLEQYYKWLDDRLNECNTYEAQEILKEVDDLIKKETHFLS